jgi:hypothetical protein
MSPEENEEKRITRRKFVQGAVVVGAGALVSCASPTPQVVKETVEVPVEVTKIVKETVEVPVEVTKIVEVAAGATPEASVAAGPVTLEMADPTGATEVTQIHAARLDTLEGKTICELSNDSWQAQRTFPYLRELLQKQYPTAKIIPYTEFKLVDSVDAVEPLKTAGCDAVIVGNGG